MHLPTRDWGGELDGGGFLLDLVPWRLCGDLLQKYVSALDKGNILL